MTALYHVDKLPPDNRGNPFSRLPYPPLHFIYSTLHRHLINHYYSQFTARLDHFSDSFALQDIHQKSMML